MVTIRRILAKSLLLCILIALIAGNMCLVTSGSPPILQVQLDSLSRKSSLASPLQLQTFVSFSFGSAAI